MAAPPAAVAVPEAAMNPAEQWVWLARILRPQGRKGEVFTQLLTDFPEKFSERKRLWLVAGTSSAGVGAGASTAVVSVPREVELVGHWLHKGGAVLQFAGVDSISAAETLKGLIVAIPSMIFYRYFRARVDGLLVEMESQAVKLVEVIHDQRRQG